MIDAAVVEKKDDGEIGDQEMLREANSIIDKWLDNEQVCNNFLYDGAGKFPELVGAKITIEQVLDSFDTMKYFRMKGNENFPTVTMLARIHFSRLDNAGF